MIDQPKIIVAITGASGSVYAKRLLDKLTTVSHLYAELAVIFSDPGRKVWEYEIGKGVELPPGVRSFDSSDYFAPPASGSANYQTMIVIPCSMGTLARIAHGTADNLIVRAADVILKERRKLILVPRETPLSLIHINNMHQLTLAGALVCPASPSFYTHPQTIEELTDTIVDRVLDLAGVAVPQKRWGL